HVAARAAQPGTAECRRAEDGLTGIVIAPQVLNVILNVLRAAAVEPLSALSIAADFVEPVHADGRIPYHRFEQQRIGCGLLLLGEPARARGVVFGGGLEVTKKPVPELKFSPLVVAGHGQKKTKRARR